MDILILSHLVPYPTTSGVLLRCYNLLRQVAQYHRVYLYAFNQSVLLPADQLQASIEHLREFCEEVNVFPIPTEGSTRRYATLLARNLFSREPYSLPRYYSSAMEEGVIDLLSRRAIQIVQYETIAMAPYGALAPDLPQILVHQNVESQLLARRARSHRDPLKRWYIGMQAQRLRNFEERYLESIDAHVAVSDEDRDAFLRMVPRARARTVVNGVDIDYFKSHGTTPDPNRMIFVGGMSWYPNRDAMSWFFDSIWKSIIAKKPDAKITIVGSHPSPEVERVAAADRRVRVTGLVPDIRPYMAAASLVICPFRVGGGTRLKILDAWGMGKPVLSTGIGCEGLKAVHGNDMWIADDPDTFADAAVSLLDDAERRQQLGTAGRRRAESEFAWPRVAQGMLDLYDTLAAEHKAPLSAQSM